MWGSPFVTFNSAPGLFLTATHQTKQQTTNHIRASSCKKDNFPMCPIFLQKKYAFSVWEMHSTYLNWNFLLYKLTWPLRIAPEICGARNPIMFPTELVIPIKVPANLGAISSWLQVTALKLKPLMPKVAQSKTTTRYLWQPTKWSIHKQIAGGINAENGFLLYQNIIDFWKICLSWSPHYFTNSWIGEFLWFFVTNAFCEK